MRIHLNDTNLTKARFGFTLVEVMVGVAIMAILFVTFYIAIAFGMSEIRLARENLRATQILVNHMEGIRLFTWAELSDTNMLPPAFNEFYNPMGATNGTQGITYTGAVSVASANLGATASYSTNMYMITVQVQWSSSGVVRTRQMSTYASLDGIQNYVYSNPD